MNSAIIESQIHMKTLIVKSEKFLGFVFILFCGREELSNKNLYIN